ncbi:SDR family oxidoreductase [candidate division WOR-3 bacterium]|nr:SDR family oxidoreductase [candidate division WOR-3 bacterium]
MKKILVTGHNGFIGPLLVKLLTENGYNVVGLDTNYFGHDCELYSQENGIREIVKDIRNVDEKDLEGIDAVCHLAALSNDPLGQLNEDLTYSINYESTVHLAKLAKKAGVKKFVYSSSCSLYGVAGDKALTEEAAFNPVTAYAKSKVLSENAILQLSDKDFCTTSLRNATAYGISPKLRVDLVVNNLVGWALTIGKIKILSDGTPWRPIVHAEDIARAFIAVIEAPAESVNGQAFNVGINSENYQVKDIATIISQIIPDCEIIITGEYGPDSRTYKVNFDKIKNYLPNFIPKWNLTKGVEEIVESYRKNKLDDEKFSGRYFIRLKQLEYLLSNKFVNEKLYWS